MSVREHGKLQLGVKGKLSVKEMEELRRQLAEAVAYDHKPTAKAPSRSTKPMTKIYKKSSHAPPPIDTKPDVGRKPLRSIQYEEQFRHGTYDSLTIRPPKHPPRDSQMEKRVLQEAYEANQVEEQMGMKKGKKQAPEQIQQVFLM